MRGVAEAMCPSSAYGTTAFPFSLIPTRVYLSGGRVKVQLELGQGKDVGDKRQSIKEREMKREMDRAGADHRRGR